MRDNMSVLPLYLSILNFVGKIFVVSQKDKFASVLNFVGIIFVV